MQKNLHEQDTKRFYNFLIYSKYEVERCNVPQTLCMYFTEVYLSFYIVNTFFENITKLKSNEFIILI